MNKNKENMTRAEYRAQQNKKNFLKRIFKKTDEKSASNQDDDFLVFNEDGNTNQEVDTKLVSQEEKIRFLKSRLNLGIIITFILQVFIFLILWYV